MKRSIFEDEFDQLVADSIGINPNSRTNMDDAYDTYIDLIRQINKGNDSALEQMVRMKDMTGRERLRWRMALSNSGIEMTPSQVDEYIVLLTMAISNT